MSLSTGYGRSIYHFLLTLINFAAHPFADGSKGTFPLAGRRTILTGRKKKAAGAGFLRKTALVSAFGERSSAR